MTDSQAHESSRRSGWVGWIYFAGILLVVGAAIDIFYGVMAIVGPNTAYFVGHVRSLPAQPWWAIVMIAFDVLVIYAVTVHGRELRTPRLATRR